MSDSGRAGPGADVYLLIATVAVAVVILSVGGMFAVMAWMGGGGHMGRVAGSDQAPVVSMDGEVAVEVRDYVYFPDDLTVDAGATVTWTNTDAVPHDATAEDGAFATDLIMRDKSASVTFDAPGEYPYICSIHPYMNGLITVR